MLGSDQVQRANAVGHHTSYIPDADPGRHGGNTYSGQATEATIQDYENFFGPSARDIKTDLQRFKRHGRWHLPDVLKGPNPWLTDRIDGLITDATNSPFTTKILPYRYKEDVDGKLKWNVWNFDEGMASRVPYESAARTLQQSKRSFAGYMVRQGMAIVLEHNFMMTPKGRENFKNQLNQLIGSIQYTNDLDVHMALVLAPSYQKTMRERYYTLDKSPSQICREFVDLFGMMQKNVNALDILIEEGKAILRTWGGPMPDFLLCNSKLTFQMTMTPEKTNYITQGTDGVKRLRQGPDLGSYRGLSVIHSRSFAMEVGQHPRDILRRRVRTAEYYRILPDKNNVKREFEFYNEERDTWFTLTFQELLRYARYPHEGAGGDDNPAAVDRAFNILSNPASKQKPAPGSGPQPQILGQPLNLHAQTRWSGGAKGAGILGIRPQDGPLEETETTMLQTASTMMDGLRNNIIMTLFNLDAIAMTESSAWMVTNPCFDLGIKHVYPKKNRVWKGWMEIYNEKIRNIPKNFPQSYVMNSVNLHPRLPLRIMEDLYNNLKSITLNDPFSPGQQAIPRTAEWYEAFAFYTNIYKRSGIPMAYFEQENLLIPGDASGVVNGANSYDILRDNLRLLNPAPARNDVDITTQILGVFGDEGSVNHPFFLQIDAAPLHDNRAQSELTGFVGRFLLTYEILGPLLRKYKIRGAPVTGIEYLKSLSQHPSDNFREAMGEIFQSGIHNEANIRLNTLAVYPFLKRCIDFFLRDLEEVDGSMHDAVVLAKAGINTFPLGITSVSHIFHPLFSLPASEDIRDMIATIRAKTRPSFGHLNIEAIKTINDLADTDNFPCIWIQDNLLDTTNGQVPNATDDEQISRFWDLISDRLFLDPVNSHASVGILDSQSYMKNMPFAVRELYPMRDIQENQYFAKIPRISDQNLGSVSINLDRLFFEPSPPVMPPESTIAQDDISKLQDIEIVIIRPNIEHNMLGVIMGLGGESLGNTLWGQTELSVYDDSMHGIWGMSYKYHERAIVFNEKNLIRLWDIAYDGYNGGKDDTHVDWLNPDTPNGYQTFKELTLDVSKNYRGPSMMVMAFVHNRERRDREGNSMYDTHFRRNWPSPIVFHDSRVGATQHGADKETLPVDYDNLQVIDVDEFRVFNNPLYSTSYSQYRALMPHFHEMHMMRKTAGQSSADAETHTDSLAFQGSMKIKENGTIMQEIHGSGHHGPDYTGVASVRAGKGQKTAGQAPTLHRLI